eukprot:6485756-Amphidinium_carterae.1
MLQASIRFRTMMMLALACWWTLIGTSDASKVSAHARLGLHSTVMTESTMEKRAQKLAGASMLQKMNALIQTTGKSGLTPAEKAEVTEIRQILNMDIMPSLLAAAEDAQQLIDRYYQDVLDCQVEVTTGLEVNRQLWTDTITKEKLVTTCVQEEVVVIVEETEVCKKYSETRTTLRPPELPAHLDPNDNSQAFKFLKEMSDRFCQIEETFVHEWQECEILRENKTELIDICETKAKEYEEAICGWDAELVETCTEYMGCWNDAIAAYNNHVSSLVNLQEDWEAEMEAVEKLDCLWYVWNLSSDPCEPNMTKVYECEEVPVDVTNVTLIVYEIPEPRSCPPPPEDEAQDNPALPCSDEFMNSHFGYLGLPISEMEEMKMDCRECPHTRPDGWVSTSYVPGYTAGYTPATTQPPFNVALPTQEPAKTTAKAGTVAIATAVPSTTAKAGTVAIATAPPSTTAKAGPATTAVGVATVAPAGTTVQPVAPQASTAAPVAATTAQTAVENEIKTAPPAVLTFPPAPTTAAATTEAPTTIPGDESTTPFIVSTTATCTELYSADLVGFVYDAETGTTSFTYTVSCKYGAEDIEHWDLVGESPEEVVILEKNFNEEQSTVGLVEFAEDEGGILAIQATGDLKCKEAPAALLRDGTARNQETFSLVFNGNLSACLGEFMVKAGDEPLMPTGCPCDIPCLNENERPTTTTTTTTTTTRCPAYCRAPECVEGDLASGGWLLDDGHCTASCSAPGPDGLRKCGLGQQFESSEDAIFCSECLLPEASCVLWGDPHIVPFDREVRNRNGRGASVHMYAYGDYWSVKGEMISIQARYWSTRRDGNSQTRALAVGGPFLDGNVLIIEPLNGKVLWTGTEILTDYPSTFIKEGLVFIEYHNEAEVVRNGGQHDNIKGLDIMMPLGPKWKC